MKQKTLKKNFVIIFIACCMLIFSSCAQTSPFNSGSETEIMDFNQKLVLKKPAQPIKKDPFILFLGNSMTFYNDLPSTFLALSSSGGFEPEVYELTEGAYRLEFFADKTDELGAQVYQALQDSDWDYVILQEQSRLPTMDAEDLMYPAARTLDGLIQNANAQTTFLMTWAYKEGDSFSILGKQYVSTREEMQTQLANSYIKIANELDALLSPAGIAFMKSASQYPDIELWDEDLTHPSPAGTYLTACVLYASLFDQSPVGLEYIADLDAQTAKILQQIAAETVLD